MDDDKLDQHCYLQQFHNYEKHPHSEESTRPEWWELPQPVVTPNAK